MNKIISKLGLNSENSVVIGSGILQALKIRKSNDIDLVVTSEVFNTLKKLKRFTILKNHGRETLKDNLFEIGEVWNVLGKSYKFGDFLDNSVIIDKVRYITVEFLLKAKQSWVKNDKDVRQKDVEDIKLMKEYMKNKKDHLIPTNKMVEKYLIKISVSKKDFYASKEIPLESTKLILLLGLKDYFENRITTNDIDSLANVYWTDTNIWDPKEWDKQDKKLGTVLLWLSELSYYSTRSKEFPDLEKIEKHIFNISKDYYEEFKHLIERYQK